MDAAASEHLVVKRDGDITTDHARPAGEAQRARPRRDGGADGGAARRRRDATPAASCSRPTGRCSRPATTSATWPAPSFDEARHAVRRLHADDGRRAVDPAAGVSPRCTRWPPPPAASWWPSATWPSPPRSAGFAIPGRQGRAVLPHAARRRRPQHRPQAGAGDGVHRRRDRRRHGRRVGPDQPGRARRRARRRRRRPDAPGHPRAAAVEGARQAGFYAQVDLDQAEAYEYAIEVMAAAADDRRRPGGHRRLPREAHQPDVRLQRRACHGHDGPRPGCDAGGPAAIVAGGCGRCGWSTWRWAATVAGRAGRTRSRTRSRSAVGTPAARASASSDGQLLAGADHADRRASRRASWDRPTPRSPTAAGPGR